MATITAFIRTSKKSKEVNIRFRLRDGRSLQLFHTSEYIINSDLWSDEKQAIKAKVLYNEIKRTEFNKSVNERKSLIADIYSKNVGKDDLTSEWLEIEIDKRLHPDKYGVGENQQKFFETFEEFLENRKLSQVRKNNFRVIIRALKRFELYKTIKNLRAFELTLEAINVDTLHDIDKFLRNEHTFFNEYPQIYEKVPETRTPQPRGQNTINDVFTKIRTFFLWAIDRGLTNNNPFKTFSIEECVYGTPIYITIEERNRLYKTNLKRHPKLTIQKDIFVFQCVIGCRVGDLYKMTRHNIIDGAIEYVAGKTKDNRPKTIRVPLNQIAQEILDKYKGCDGKLFPFISEQKYNVAIKRIFLAARLKRPVTIINPQTREAEIKPLYTIASSHLARRTFVGNLYKQVKDPNLVGSLSGHKEGSKAFARYRDIDEDMKKDLVKLLE
ncbi:MAG: hypothetical protein RL662_297 [Bacteroidota bacterium]|jgi:integrase